MEKLNNIKLLVLDLDYTIVNPILELINKKVVDSIIKVQKKGIKVIINTGRSINDCLWISDKLELAKYDGYVVGLNGSIIYNPKTKTINVIKKLTKKQKEILLYASEVIKISIVFFSNKPNSKGFVYKRKISFFLFSIFKNFFRFSKISKIDILNKDISSGLVFGSIENLKKFVDLVSKHSESIFFSSGMKKTIQFSLTDKKIGLDYILKKFKINDNEVMIIGDNLNDLPLFMHFKYSIAMGNSVNEIKHKAFYITNSYLYNGAAIAIEKFLL